ncbi:alpha/beta hydrolase [Luedemannella flava]|uniref:Alpha/beta hydrolase n=1 Tax=Luedemannella flava TaxID=349316 RepID=A0ABN2MF55_9ACTN
MPTVTSADGTPIAYDVVGSGPAVVLVDGAMCHRSGAPMLPLSHLLKPHFTVYSYDRRGRGGSGDTAPYAVAREVEDLAAIVTAAGGCAHAFGMSSGGALILAGTAAGVPLTRLALYEPPFLTAVDPDAGQRKKEFGERLRDLLDAGRAGDAVALFMTYVGVPAAMVEGMRGQPFWPAFEAIGPTLAYDDAVLGDGRVPADAARVTVPTLVLGGGASPEALQAAARAAADAVPGATHRTLPDQTHDVAVDALAPVLTEFFS